MENQPVAAPTRCISYVSVLVGLLIAFALSVIFGRFSNIQQPVLPTTVEISRQIPTTSRTTSNEWQAAKNLDTFDYLSGDIDIDLKLLSTTWLGNITSPHQRTFCVITSLQNHCGARW